MLILAVGILPVHRGVVQIGGLAAVLQLAAVIDAPIEVLAYLLHRRNEVLPLLKQLEALTPEHPLEAKTHPCQAPFTTLSAEGLSYQAGDLPILQNVSVTFQAGEKCLLTGESGSGKSTLLRLLSQTGSLDYTGTIRLNQTDAKSIAPSSSYQQICPVLQEPYLFRATLRENILLGREVPEETYRAVIKKLHLAYLLDRCCGQELTPEMMEQLSSGERQRVALDRAMIGKPAVYLLDEVTSALDQENAERVERLLLEEDTMVLHVCHKPNASLAPLYDSHLLLANGVLHKA